LSRPAFSAARVFLPGKHLQYFIRLEDAIAGIPGDLAQPRGENLWDPFYISI
jgi:hypothetical protein